MNIANVTILRTNLLGIKKLVEFDIFNFVAMSKYNLNRFSPNSNQPIR